MAARKRKSVVGQSVGRLEDGPLLTGEARFVDDLNLSDALQGAFLRSPHAHAEIRGIDTAAALAQPGVTAVLTAKDLPPGLRIPMRMFARDGMERFLQPPLAEDVTRYSGEPIALVLADSRYTAEDAAELIEVEYRQLPVVGDGEQALGPEAAVLFPEAGTNLASEFTVGDSSIDAVFERAHLVVEEKLSVQRHAAVPMEPRGLAASHDPAVGTVTVWGAAKIVHINRNILARLLGMAPEKVRLIELEVGGGFGARGEFYPEDFLIPYAAIKSGRPVAWTSDREEDLRSTNHSREQVHEIGMALDADGQLLGLRDRVTFNTGAYVRTHGTVVSSMTGALLPGPYRWGAYHCQVRHVVTNKTPAGTYRSPGRYEANFARERLLDIAAHRLKIDPGELRRRNLVPVDQMPYDTGAQLLNEPIVYDSGDYPVLFEKGMKRFEYDRMLAWRDQDPGPRKRRGIGLGYFVEKSAIGKWDYARVELSSQGGFVVHVGAASIGQGLRTTMAQICADAVEADFDDVSGVYHGDTASVPDGMGSFGSRATVITGGAVHRAGIALRERILEYAADRLEASPDDLRIGGGKVAVKGSRGRGIALSEIAEAGLAVNALADQRRPGFSEEAYYEVDQMSFPYGLHCVAVEVDTETGAVRIERYMVAYDVGKAVNPMMVHGQIVGGAAQGVGGALLEDLSYSPDGQLVAGSFMDYLMPTAIEAPALDVLITEDAPSPLSPIGAKGAGEGGTAASAAALANAVSDALGTEVLDLPLSPERVRELGGVTSPRSNG